MTTRIALIGATGLVGQEFLKIFSENPSAPSLNQCEIIKVASYARPQEKVISFDEMLSAFSTFSYFINAADADQAKVVASRLEAQGVLCA